jgi:hypothetical protein
MKLYISGPMTGRKDLNQEDFEETATVVKQLGHHPITPFDLDVVDPAPMGDWVANMKRDIKYLVGFDGVVVLDDWIDSPGARLEVLIASRMKLPIFFLNDEGELLKLKIEHDIDTHVSWEITKNN